jgi:hypothetical protein
LSRHSALSSTSATATEPTITTSRWVPSSAASSGASTAKPMIAVGGWARMSTIASVAAKDRAGASATRRLSPVGSRRRTGLDVVTSP